MTGKFGWCAGPVGSKGDHGSCKYEIGAGDSILRCSCDCHEENQVPWFKVDDTLAFHMKTVKAGNAAMGMWVRAGSWSMQTLSDGYVPDEIAAQLGTPQQAKRLVDSGLWDRLSSGYGFHEWEQRQPTKAHVHAERAATAERQRKSREQRKEGKR